MNNVSIIIHRTVFGQVVSSLSFNFQQINHAYNPTRIPTLIVFKNVFSTYFSRKCMVISTKNLHVDTC